MHQNSKTIIPAEDWSILFDVWLDGTGEFFSVFRGNASDLVLQANISTILRRKTSLYEKLLEAGVSERTAWQLAILAQHQDRILCVKEHNRRHASQCCARTGKRRISKERKASPCQSKDFRLQIYAT